MFSVCPSCTQHHTTSRPQFWALDLEKIHEYDETDSISCHLECEMIDKWLVFPPPCKSFLDLFGMSSNPLYYSAIHIGYLYASVT